MARIVPPRWEDRNGSRAELQIYRRLRDETPDDWLAVHSVGLTSHRSKPWAEIDFVVIGPFGVLCLEVKGGRITVDEGTWSTNGQELRESPFSQAGGGAAALHRELRGRRSLERAIVGYGVVFPEVTFDAVGAGIERELVYDDRDLQRPISEYLLRIADHWLRHHGRTGDRHRPLSRAERAEIGRYVAPSFDLVPTLRARLATAEAELVRLTRTQARILRGFRDQPRALIRGGAGTGKTLLAVDEAARLAGDGRRVLLCCRSPNLAGFLARHLEADVEVWSYEALLWDLVDGAGLRDEIPDADPADVINVFLPELASEAMAAISRVGAYDALVVDEAQDLLSDGALLVFDTLLRDGLGGGVWRFFLDHKQNVFSSVDLTQLKRIEAEASTNFELVDNCRNTPEIAYTTALLSATDPDDALAESGPDVEIRWVVDRGDEPAAIGALLDTWRRRGVATGDTMVLASDDATAARLRSSHPAGLHVGSELGDPAAGQPPRLATVAQFKGLEAAAVIVVGAGELSALETLRSMYVACSRSRVLLGVVLRESAREDFGRRSVELLRRNER
jgi:Nuclease-related domain/Uncharacterized conserved protein (DUF2075)